MKTTRKLAVATALFGPAGFAQAVTVTDTSTPFKVDTNLTSTATSSSNITPGGTAPALAQFNPGTGVLTGAALRLIVGVVATAARSA